MQRTFEQQQDWIFGQIVKRLAQDNGVPLATGGAREVIAEVEFAAQILLFRRRELMPVNSPQLAVMVADWRGIDGLRRGMANSAAPVSMPAAA